MAHQNIRNINNVLIAESSDEEDLFAIPKPLLLPILNEADDDGKL